ncbi:MAG TPA: hypothetical protein VGR35_04620 [Tepidisphaeraceae bacterium]|nr:hypothetical protein [Tepidisphaeraceae bacterium]
MSLSGLFSFGWRSLPVEPPDPREHLVVQRPLRRVLAFTGRSIDDVVNDPVVKREVLGYYKLHKQIQRAGEVGDLERQWNTIRR